MHRSVSLFLLSVLALTGVYFTLAATDDPAEKPEISKTATTVPATANGDAWTVFRGNSALNGVAETVLKPPLKLAWKLEMTGPIVATAAIANGTVYLGSQDGDFRAIDLATGTEKWMKQLGDTLESSAAILNGKVYVGSGDGHLYALDMKSGDELWKYKTDGEILGGVNYFTKDGKSYVYVGSYDNFMHCVNPDTGEMVWKAETGNYVNGTPAIADGKVMFGGCDAILYMVDAVTGKPDGQIEIGSYVANSVSVKDGLVYMAHYGNQAEAYSIAEKKQVWVHQERDFPYFASPLVTDQYVLVADRGKRLYCLNRNDGSVKWSFRARRSIDSSAVASGDLAYVGSDDGRLYAVGIETGKEVWSYDTGDAITAAPAIAAGHLIVGGQDGFVYAFKPVN